MSNTLLERIDTSTPIDFGDIFSKSFELFKKVWLQGFIHLLISFAVMIPVLLMLYIPLFIVIGYAGYEADHLGLDISSGEDISAGFIVLFAFLMIVIIIIASAVQLGITAHFYRVCKQIDHGLPPSSRYFMFLKRAYFTKTLILALSIFGISIAATLLCYLPIFYVLVPLHLLRVMFAFYPDMDVSDLVKASFKLGNKYWLTIFGLIFVCSFLAVISGYILCVVGVFFTTSFALLPAYYVFKEAVGFDQAEVSEENTL